MHEEEEEEEEHATGRRKERSTFTPGLLNVTSTDLELALQAEDGKIVHFADGESRSAEGTELPMTAMILRGDQRTSHTRPDSSSTQSTGSPISQAYLLATTPSKRGVGNTLTPPIKTVSEESMKPM